jgi:RNA polymerase sigma-70 factor (ECF subfamily)
MTTSEGGDDPRRPGEGDPTFAEFLRRVRAGDEWAAVELVRRYEPALRLEIRLRLRDPKLRRLLEPDDLCQSVLKSFFVRAASGQYDLESPTKLLALLRAMARNKVAKQARNYQTLRRDLGRDVSLDTAATPVAATGPSPSRIAIGREILDAFRGRLTAEERRLADLRAQGCEWAEIARELGGTP